MALAAMEKNESELKEIKEQNNVLEKKLSSADNNMRRFIEVGGESLPIEELREKKEKIEERINRIQVLKFNSFYDFKETIKQKEKVYMTALEAQSKMKEIDRNDKEEASRYLSKVFSLVYSDTFF